MQTRYVQFHPLSYIVKLNIELCMSDLISKVVRKRDRTDKPHDHDSSSNPSQGTELPSTKSGTFRGTTLGGSKSGGLKSHITSKVREEPLPEQDRKGRSDSEAGSIESSNSSDSGINFRVPEDGIVRTVAVQVEVDDIGGVREGDDGERSTKSTSRLRGGW